MNHIALFAGIGGDTLAAQWAGFETVLFVENDEFCQKVLAKNFPGVPIIGDIKDATKEAIANATQQERPQGKVQTEGEVIEICPREPRCAWDSFPPITLITGGFPCQPVSHAGKRRGKEDDRWLWPEMLRVISEVRPAWVVAENVAGLIGMGLDDCISDLESEGYEVQTFLIPACAVNAPHRRDRIFIVANSPGGQVGQKLDKFTSELLSKDGSPPESQGSGGDVANPAEQRPGYGDNGNEPPLRATEKSGGAGSGLQTGESWWSVEPDVGRVAYGVPSRVDRLKGLGNAIVPQQIYPILKAIYDIQKGIA